MEGNVLTSWYEKDICSGRILNFLSYHSLSTKVNVAKRFCWLISNLKKWSAERLSQNYYWCCYYLSILFELTMNEQSLNDMTLSIIEKEIWEKFDVEVCWKWTSVGEITNWRTIWKTAKEKDYKLLGKKITNYELLGRKIANCLKRYGWTRGNDIRIEFYSCEKTYRIK